MHPDNRKLLPIRFAPEPDELFSSWLMRLAMSHRVKLHTFTKFVFPEIEIWNRDIDKSAGFEHITHLSSKTGLPFLHIFATTLRSLEGSLYENHNANGNLSWILPAGIYHRKRKRYGLQMCPICLSEDERPFFRRLWRVAWVTACLKHQVVLLDRCPKCHNPIIFHRGDMGWRNQFVSYSMKRCSVCDLLWTSKEIIESLTPANTNILFFQQKMELALIDNWFEVQSFGYVHSINFFNGLKHLLRVLSISRRGIKFRRAVGNKSRISLEEFELIDKPVHSFEYLSVKERHKAIQLAFWILEDWKERFIDTALTCDAFSSIFLPYNEAAPFWYWFPVQEHLVRKSYPVSEQEIISALIFLEKKRSFILPRDLETLLGRQIFDHKTNNFKAWIFERIKNFNFNREQERLKNIKDEAKKIVLNSIDFSKSKAQQLSLEHLRKNYKHPKSYKKSQSMLTHLVKKYKGQGCN